MNTKYPELKFFSYPLIDKNKFIESLTKQNDDADSIVKLSQDLKDKKITAEQYIELLKKVIKDERKRAI